MKLQVATYPALYARQITGIVVRLVKTFTIKTDPLAGRHPHNLTVWGFSQGRDPLLSSPIALRVASRGLDRFPPKGDGRGVVCWTPPPKTSVLGDACWRSTGL